MDTLIGPQGIAPVAGPASSALADDVAAIARIDVVSKILEVVCRTTGLGFSAVARVTENRWIACAIRDEIAFGLEPGGELPVETTICDEIRDTGQIVVIDHASEDARFCGHPTPQLYGFQSYISVPIYRLDGRFFGTLCALDPMPARLNNPGTIGMFTLFADLIARHLDALERLAYTEVALLDERRGAELREQFIAVLGHDLRNPLAAIQGAAQMLLRGPLDARAARFATTIMDASLRMDELIRSVMDFAHGRLGGGLKVTRVPDASLQTKLEQIVTELRTAWPDRDIRSEFAINCPVVCDGARIAQLLSNLLANAVIHGDPDGTVCASARSDERGFALSVANHGEPIPSDAQARLFQPFSRISAQPGQGGLGLGLYIASEIARAHEGSLEVSSTAAETRFTFRMPMPESVLS